VAQGADLTEATVGDHMTWKAVVATTSWDVETSARTMIEGGFRHLVVVEDGREVGVLSIRDLVLALLERSGAGTGT
jgi:CBS domain-containing protein